MVKEIINFMETSKIRYFRIGICGMSHKIYYTTKQLNTKLILHTELNRNFTLTCSHKTYKITSNKLALKIAK